MITNYCKNGQCSRCGACCTPFIPVSNREIKRIRAYLIKHLDIAREASQSSEDENGNYYVSCCFFKDNKCLIYPVRPLICQMFKCDQSEDKIVKNKEIAYAKATYNTEDASTISDFRYMFFDDPINIFLYIKDVLKLKTKEELKQVLTKMKREDLVEKIDIVFK